MTPRKLIIRLLACTLVALLNAPEPAPAGPKPKDWNPVIDPNAFSSTVDNRYFPLIPGTTLQYRNKTGSETLVIEVTSRTRNIMGVRTTVVVETATEDGRTVEISENWFAQDRDGNVWYFGEATQDFQNGVPVSTAGSWEAGVHGALPGIIMKARPAVGDTYFQEYAPGIAEDMASVMAVEGSLSTALASYSGVLKTKEWTPLEANSVEHKYYAPGVGLVREEKGSQWMELVGTR